LQGELKQSKGREEALKTINVDLVESSLLDYTEGFKKSMLQAFHFNPSINVDDFDLSKDVVNDHLIDD